MTKTLSHYEQQNGYLGPQGSLCHEHFINISYIFHVIFIFPPTCMICSFSITVVLQAKHGPMVQDVFAHELFSKEGSRKVKQQKHVLRTDIHIMQNDPTPRERLLNIFLGQK